MGPGVGMSKHGGQASNVTKSYLVIAYLRPNALKLAYSRFAEMHLTFFYKFLKLYEMH